MEFEEWLKKEGPILARLGALPVELKQMKAAYRAGLLHAAEQDEGIAKQNKDLPITCPRAYEYSAIFHREAANDLK